MTAQQLRTMRLVSLCTAVLTLVVYLSTLTHVHTFDALSYILDVSRKPWQQLFHPHHLAYGPFGAMIASLSQTDTATALQLANAVAGSIGSGLLFATVYRRWHRVDVALLAAFSCAFSYAYWYYAVEVEVYTLATLCIIAVLWLAMDPAPARVRWRVGLAVALAGAVLFHQTNALLAIPLVVRAWPDLRAGGIARRGWLIAGAGGVAIVVLAYAWVMGIVSGFTTYSAAHQWLFDYVDSGWWGGRATLTDIRDGLADTVAAGWGGYLAVATVVLSALSYWSTRTRLEQPWLVVWMVTYGVFFSWWEPDNIEFWIATTPIAVMFLVAPLAQVARTDRRVLIAFALLLTSFAVNLTAIRVRGDAQTDLQRRIALAVAEASQPADLVLVPDGLQELYLPYYQHREHFLSVNAAIAAQGSWEAGCASIQESILQTHRAGAAVLLASDFLTPSETMQQRYGLSPQAVSDCVADILPLLEDVPMPAGVPAHTRLPNAGALLSSDRWAVLTGTPLGWMWGNATPQPADAGWQLGVSLDPSITTPILDRAMPKRVVMTIAATGTADRRGQLFVATALNQFDEAHAVAWTYGEGRQTIAIELGQISALPSRLIQLRIDPVADGAGGSVTLYGISLEYK
ncbi:MAG: DUF2723 domain-containing protein [Chloroflexi bacterium]|nr:MAG: DUF2723 domain-containing protein [Chloroflexota bacterium]